MKDLIIGSITNYTFEDIRNWVVSLERSGFTGHKLMMVYDVDNDVVKELVARKFSVFSFGFDQNTLRHTYSRPNYNIVVDRFLNTWKLLNELDLRDKENIRNVILTDVKDVIFQRNPSKTLDLLDDQILFASSEGITYEHESWGNQNMKLSFPWAHEFMQDKIIYNAGVIAGRLETIKELCLAIYNMIAYMPAHIPGGGGPDQAAYNILLRHSYYKENAVFMNHKSGWAAQLGTTADPNKIDSYRPHITGGLPVIKDGMVYTEDGILFDIVHQYNRVPELNQIVNERYANE